MLENQVNNRKMGVPLNVHYTYLLIKQKKNLYVQKNPIKYESDSHEEGAVLPLVNT